MFSRLVAVGEDRLDLETGVDEFVDRGTAHAVISQNHTLHKNLPSLSGMNVEQFFCKKQLIG